MQFFGVQDISVAFLAVCGADLSQNQVAVGADLFFHIPDPAGGHGRKSSHHIFLELSGQKQFRQIRILGKIVITAFDINGLAGDRGDEDITFAGLRDVVNAVKFDLVFVFRIVKKLHNVFIKRVIVVRVELADVFLPAPIVNVRGDGP